MKILAYARRTKTSPVTDQIAAAEDFARRSGHDVQRLLGHDLDSGAEEFPAWSAVLEACQRGLVDGLVVTDPAALGFDLVATLRELGTGGTRLLVVGERDRNGVDAGVLRSAIEAAIRIYEDRAERPRRICPPRVPVNVSWVRARQAEGATLAALSQELGIARSTLSKKLRKDRERAAQ